MGQPFLCVTAVQEYLKAPPASTLPCPEFPMAGPSQSSSSVRLEEGMHQMSEVITGILETVLSDQGPQESSVKNVWKTLKKGKITTSNCQGHSHPLAPSTKSELL